MKHATRMSDRAGPASHLTPRLRIGVDATCWANRRGYGRFTREVLRTMIPMAPESTFVCLLDARAADTFDAHGPNVEPVVVNQRVSPTEAAAAHGHRSPFDMLRLTRATARAGVDVFFSPSLYTFYPLPLRLPAVVTVHDVIADRHPRLTLPSSRARLFWRLKRMLALRQATLVLTVSAYAEQTIAATLGVAPDRIRVAVEAPSPIFRPTEDAREILGEAGRLGLPADARWCTYVGGFGPHKNVEALVRAHAAVVRRAGASAPYLLLIGAVEGEVFYEAQARIRSAIAACGTEAFVRWTGFLQDDQIRHLHSGAIALLLPSREEGFGLPAVEAAACGAPVIVTSASPLGELLEDGAIVVDPDDEAALEAAAERLFVDEPARRRIGARALECASRLTWTDTATAALGAIREAALRGRGR